MGVVTTESVTFNGPHLESGHDVAVRCPQHDLGHRTRIQSEAMPQDNGQAGGFRGRQHP